MKISLEWLSDFVDFKEKDPLKIADALTKSTGEIDHVELQGRFLQNVVVGKVIEVGKHPNADKLSIATVETDQGKKRIVCGGTNVKEGMLVAFAHIGATVKWHGNDVMTLERVKIRGEESEGMICAAEELDLGSEFAGKKEDGERPIVDLTYKRLKVGMPLKEALGMNDAVLHIDNHAITNRPDLFSHIGIARECVALGLAKWKKTKEKKVPKFPAASASFETKNECKDLVPRYLATTLSINSVGETPDWMKKRLETTGWRSVNLPVDITNYVTMELGMPLHSFDTDDLQGTVTIRKSKANESVKTLDDIERKLPEGAVVLSDQKGIFDLLGIMGGLRSSTKTSTRNILLHSAIVDGATVRKAIIATGHRTDAATVYEKNIPFVTAETGFYRALELFLELLPGATITSKLQTNGTNGTAKAISVSEKKLASFIGIEIPKKDITAILTDLGANVSAKADTFSVTPPLWRNDLKTPADIYEEVSRIYGYNDIAPNSPMASVQIPAREKALHRVRDGLKESGFRELVSLSFISPELLKKCGMDPSHALQIGNPLGEELSLLRPSLLPQLLATAGREQLHTANDLKLFEYGRVFEKNGEEYTELMLLSVSRMQPTLINEPALSLKRDLVNAFRDGGHEISIEQTMNVSHWMHPERSGVIKLQGKDVGMLFEVHPSALAVFGLQFASAAMIDWDQVRVLAPNVWLLKPLPEYPSITYDETVMLPKKALSEVMKSVRSADPLLTSVETIDLYQKNTERKITLRFTYRAEDRTLNENEAKSAHTKVMSRFV